MATREVEATSKFNSAFGAPLGPGQSPNSRVTLLRGSRNSSATPHSPSWPPPTPMGTAMPPPRAASPVSFGSWTRPTSCFQMWRAIGSFQSYQNVEANPHVGLIFFIPGVNDTVRVNGKASIVTKDELDRQSVELSLYELDDNSKHLQGMLIEVDEAYSHCPPGAEVLQALGPCRDRQEPGRLPHS